MASSLAKFRHILKPPIPDNIKCTYDENDKDLHGERFPSFTRNLFLKAFPPPVRDKRSDDDKELDPTEILKPLGHLGIGRIGKTMTALKKDYTRVACNKAPKPDIKRLVALTQMDADQVDYVDAVRALEPHILRDRDLSPFICRVLLSFRSKQPYQIEYLYLVSEYWPDGSSLCKRLQEVGRFSEEDAKFYMMQVADALASIHSNGKIVRRLCLCNILIEPCGFSRIAPYSLCDQNLDCGQACNMLCSNCGDQFYASPEVVFGVDVQPAADWWSLGVCLFQVLTGQLPFTGRTLGDLGKAITEADPCILPSYLSGEAIAILKHLLHKDPRRRLGFGTHGTDDVKAHPWFSGRSWENVRGTMLTPPYVPKDAVRTDMLPHLKPPVAGPDSAKQGGKPCQKQRRL